MSSVSSPDLRLSRLTSRALRALHVEPGEPDRTETRYVAGLLDGERVGAGRARLAAAMREGAGGAGSRQQSDGGREGSDRDAPGDDPRGDDRVGGADGGAFALGWRRTTLRSWLPVLVMFVGSVLAGFGVALLWHHHVLAAIFMSAGVVVGLVGLYLAYRWRLTEDVT